MHRRAFVLGSLALAASGCATTGGLGESERTATDALGQFEHVPGRAGVVVGVPHGTADTGALAVGRRVRARLQASGVFVTGFWDGQTRVRINVNRDTEQTMGRDSEVLHQQYSARAAHVNARYVALVREAAQGPLRWFVEVHSNSYPRFQTSVEVSTLGVSHAEARHFKDAFLAARARRVTAQTPELGVSVAPVDRVWFSYQGASAISSFSEKGCLIELPSTVIRDATARGHYADVLGDVLAALVGE